MIETLFDQPVDQIKKFNGNAFLIYGAGNTGHNLLNQLIVHNIEVLGFIDKRYESMKEFHHIPVFSLANAINKFSESCPVLIAIHNRDVNMNDVMDDIKIAGFKNIYTMFDYVNNFPNDDTFRFFLTATKNLLPQAQDATQFFNLLSDDKSKIIYQKLISFRLTGQYENCPLPEPERQYAPTDIPEWQNNLKLIDCGAYNGDSIKCFLEYGYQFDNIIAFEPDPDNYAHLVKNCHMLPIHMLPCGVSSHASQVSFNIGNGEASRLSKDGNSLVQMMGIDEAFPNWAPNLIKMDIEGGEYEAIKGASNTIKKYTPGLAISAYHLPEDLWRLGLFIHSINHNYQFYLRSHAYSSFDTVLYAIPNH